MKHEKLELLRGTGNIFRHLGHENALDRDQFTVRAAHARTGFAAADFSRVRNAGLARFTADRLISMLNKLGSRIEIRLRVRPIASPPKRAA